MSSVLALCGAATCGKSTLASALCEERGYIRMSFASPTYNMMSVLLGEDARSIDKTIPLDQLGGKTLRYALQTLGTEWGRDTIFGELWCDAVIRDIKNMPVGSKVVIDDARFPNEFLALRGVGASVVKIIRRGSSAGDGAGHESERYWEAEHADLTLLNNGDSADEFIRDAINNIDWLL